MSSESIKQAVQQQFGSAAAAYATSTVHQKGADLAVMIEAAQPQAHWMVLDAGCGAGHTGLAFAPHVAHVTACDLTPSMLEQVEMLAAERGLTNISTREADVEKLPFDDASFDLVVSRYSAHHWPHPETAMREFARVLKPGGAFILSDIVASEDYAADTFLQTLELVRDPSHVRDYRVSEWLTFLQGAGFAAEVVQPFDVPLDFKAWLQRIGTTDVHAAALRSLFTGAPSAIKQLYHLPDQITDDAFEFMIYGAVLRGTKL
jgi:ubiquinone/menaquinone biosynthesis C-methylase UbiE